MGVDQSGCRQCGEALPIGANYCPACGLARQSPLLDPLGVGAPGLVDAAPVGAGSGADRLRVLFGLGVAVVAVAVVWAALTAGGSEPDGSEDVSGSDEGVTGEVGSSTTAPTTTETTTTEAPSSTSSPGPESAEAADGVVGYANDVAGPVLGPDVDGVIVSVRDKYLGRLDLATGEVESIDLEWFVDQSSTFDLVFDGKLVSTSGNNLVLTDLRTGEQGERIELDVADSGPTQLLILGRAGPDSVWLTTYGSSGDRSTAIEVDLSGATLQELQLDPIFSPQAAMGRVLYLYGANTVWRYDTMSEAVEQTGSAALTRAGDRVVVSCDSGLVCGARVETPSGLEPVPWLSTNDVGGPILISPDHASALVTDQRLVSDVGFDSYPLASHIDLATGRRTDLGHPHIDLYLGVVWLDDGEWFIGRGRGRRARLVAVNIDSGEEVFIDLPQGADAFAGEPYESTLLLQPEAA